MQYFVRKDSIVRRIWGKGDTILFIFAGASAEFALNKAVDWLYYTGKLPSDPLGRLFSTVSYARMIVFSEMAQALKAIDTMAHIHAGVEARRGTQIPDWAYQDVLFMLIDYSIRAHELLEHRLSESEKHEVFDVFRRVGMRMNLSGLPQTYDQWLLMREQHMQQNLVKSPLTLDLYRQYQKHLGPVRYWFLKQAQILVVPQFVRHTLGLGTLPLLAPVLALYKLSRPLKLDGLLKSLLLPKQYQEEIRNLDVVTAS